MILRVVERGRGRARFILSGSVSVGLAVWLDGRALFYAGQDGGRGRGDGQPSNRAKASGRGLSPDAAKTDHVRVIIGIRAACKVRRGRSTLGFNST